MNWKRLFLVKVMVVLLMLPMYGFGADIFIHGSAQVYFSPLGGCQDAIIQKIDDAEKEVYVASYTFSSKLVADALIRAFVRGVKVKVIVDKSNWSQVYTQIHYLYTNGVGVLIDNQHAIMHDKFILIDGIVVITGSFNFTNAAEIKNAENVIMLRTTQGYNEYRLDWGKHMTHSVEYSLYSVSP